MIESVKIINKSKILYQICLSGGAARRNRENMRLRSYQIPGSSENLSKNDVDEDSIGTEGSSNLSLNRSTESGSIHIDDKNRVI